MAMRPPPRPIPTPSGSAKVIPNPFMGAQPRPALPPTRPASPPTRPAPPPPSSAPPNDLRFVAQGLGGVKNNPSSLGGMYNQLGQMGQPSPTGQPYANNQIAGASNFNMPNLPNGPAGNPSAPGAGFKKGGHVKSKSTKSVKKGIDGIAQRGKTKGRMC